jgi:formamidopyrimidine-DNA glycosylase
LPELPEVETVARDLRPQLEGRTVLEGWAGVPGILRHPTAAEFARRIRGRRLERVGRHGKFIMVDLSGGKAPELLVIHLGMTGRLGLAEPEAEPPPHTHLRLHLSSGVELRMQDPRRFGRVLLGERDELLARGVLPRLGPEPGVASAVGPLASMGTLTPAVFKATLARSRRPLKALLLDQGKIAGLGNIYCDEACFRAGVRPTTTASSLGSRRAQRLFTAIHEALDAAVDLRGTTIADYRDGHGNAGGNQHSLQVYGRAGQPCLRCGRRLARLTLAGRTTVFCRSCQR